MLLQMALRHCYFPVHAYCNYVLPLLLFAYRYRCTCTPTSTHVHPSFPHCLSSSAHRLPCHSRPGWLGKREEGVEGVSKADDELKRGRIAMKKEETERPVTASSYRFLTFCMLLRSLSSPTAVLLRYSPRQSMHESEEKRTSGTHLQYIVWPPPRPHFVYRISIFVCGFFFFFFFFSFSISTFVSFLSLSLDTLFSPFFIIAISREETSRIATKIIKSKP